MRANVQKCPVHEDQVLQKIVEVIVRTVDPDRIILFGSRARGDATTHSDYDLLILKQGIKPEDRRPLQRKIGENLLKHKIINVDIIVQSLERGNKLKDRWDLIYYEAFNNGKVIYEA
ncbi:MAG: nucleotidyltransferase domain-containing protein [Chlorobi bacterium]|nr:nucleotidyltransferase domain-containing protein [Chlorobiota bacterium]